MALVGERAGVWREHSRWLRPLAWALAYIALWMALWSVSRTLWFLPAGLRLGALWVTPQRHWIWLALAEWTGLGLLGTVMGYNVFEPGSLALNALPWMLYAGSVALLRDGNPPGVPGTPVAMARLLAAGLLAAALVSPVLALYLPPGEGGPDQALGAFGYLFGDVVGQVVLAPLIVLLARRGPMLPEPRRLAGDLLLVLMPMLGLMAWLMLRTALGAGFGYLIAFAPLLYLGFRHGWIGPAIGLPLVGLAIEAAIVFDPALAAELQLQVGLAVIGAGALMLGASTTALRASHRLLAQRNAELSESNRSLQTLTGQLRDMSQRLTRLQEQGQRELAAELHDELGQAVTALATRISLGLRQTGDPEQRVLLESLRDQAGAVHDSLRRVLRQLRPAVLDAYGLQRALSEGPPREMLEDAGVEYRPSFAGEVDALDEDATTAIYRICQEAVTNCVRHARARVLTLRLEVVREPDGRHRRVRLEITDDGVGASRRPVSGGYGLGGIRSRVLALDGEYAFTTGPEGTRHRIELLRRGD
ncbi:MAG: histidine kinase [Rehaibacterium terrae]|uniref:histidine kinase n=1 Tax=Rehaibacterium terrae TaxID=1341696 RepID=UPI00391A172D